MKQQSIKDIQILQSESGIIIPVLGATLFAIITLLGFAVDSGNLYRGGLRIQNAADAAALAAVSRIAIEGGNYTAAARNIARENVELNGMTVDPGGIDINYNPAIRRVTVSVSASVPLILMSMIPYENPWSDWSVTRVAQAEVQSAVVSLVADHSEEMGCTWEFSCCPGGCSNSKIDKERRDMDFFVDLFDPNLDFVNLVRFATGSTRFPGMRDMDPAQPTVGGFDMADLNGVISTMGVLPPGGLEAIGSSNMCDGFQQAYIDTTFLIGDLAARGIQKERAFVLFSDGFDSALRMQFANPKNTLPAHQGHAEYFGASQPAWVTYDFYMWETEYVRNPFNINTAQTIAIGPGELIRGPIRVQMPSADPSLTFDPATDYDCSEIDLSVANPQVTGQARLQPCLNDMSFKTMTRTPVWNTQGTSWEEYKKLYYDCTLAWADWARENLSAIYAVGYGRSCAPDANDPYQGVGNPVAEQRCRHDAFLDRLAFSWNSDNNPDFATPFATTLQLQEQGRIRGDYLPADRFQDVRPRLRALHAKIARRQKIKLCASRTDSQNCTL